MSPSPAESSGAEPSPRRVPARWLLAAGLAVVQLVMIGTSMVPAPHNGGDNAGYISLAESLTRGDYTERWDPEVRPHTKYPPVFPAVIAAWITAGATSWGALKSIPVLFLLASTLLVFAWVSERKSPLFGAGVALVFGASNTVLWTSRWLLSDPTFVAATLLALWALERSERGDGGIRMGGWWILGVVSAILASFTRSAGLPLLAAVALWLVLRRDWKKVGVFGVAALVPSLVWWWRARGAGDVQYVSEFWMTDPYAPELGRIGLVGLIGRAVDNLGGYITTWVPSGLVGATGWWVVLLGVVLTGASLVGWGLRVRESARAAEWFFPLYAGLILVWPQVWSGDRFALPLLPMILFYAAEALERATARLGRKPAMSLAAAAMAIFLLPQAASWRGSVREARACDALYRSIGTYACYGTEWVEFEIAARWAGLNLPEESVVLTRKPRIFFLSSGLRSRTYPYSTDPADLRALAEATGARYVLLDGLDQQGLRYVGGALQESPQSFCAIRSFALDGGGGGARLIGLVDPASGLGGGVVQDDEGRPLLRLPPCPDDYLSATARELEPLPPGEIPLLR